MYIYKLMTRLPLLISEEIHGYRDYCLSPWEKKERNIALLPYCQTQKSIPMDKEDVMCIYMYVYIQWNTTQP